MNATGYPANIGGNPPGSSEFRNDPRPTLVPGMRAPRITPCRDGYVIIGTYQPGIGERTFDGMIRWLTEEGAAPPTLRECSWLQYMSELVAGTLSVDAFNCAYDAMCDFVAAKTKRALLDGALERKLLLAPIYDIADLRADPQLADRGYWTDVGGVTQAGPFARLSATPIQIDRPAPHLGADQALLQQPRARRAQGARHVMPVTPRDGVFAGLKVADFAWVGVGPIISKALADHGATVIHVESEVRTTCCGSLPPFKNAEPGINRSQFFANFNTSKQGLRLELNDAGDLALARKLADWADVVVKVYARHDGAVWTRLRDARGAAQRPRDVVDVYARARPAGAPLHRLRQSRRGAGRTRGDHGLADRAPVGPWGAYTDFITPRYGVAALTAALLHRDATGQGQYIDVSQIEAGIQFHAPLVLDYTVNGRVAGARGNVSDYACPHGTYRTRGVERYVAIGVTTRAQWDALAQLVPLYASSRGTASWRRGLPSVSRSKRNSPPGAPIKMHSNSRPACNAPACRATLSCVQPIYRRPAAAPL
jgi:crotonobetainyl-CoA:carnitine CoA-transferase CaiB-like acyl-CoA transferase